MGRFYIALLLVLLCATTCMAAPLDKAIEEIAGWIGYAVGALIAAVVAYVLKQLKEGGLISAETEAALNLRAQQEAQAVVAGVEAMAIKKAQKMKPNEKLEAAIERLLKRCKWLTPEQAEDYAEQALAFLGQGIAKLIPDPPSPN